MPRLGGGHPPGSGVTRVRPTQKTQRPRAQRPVSDGYATQVLGTSGLVGYWRLGELSGATANDETLVNPGVYSGSVTLNQASGVPSSSDPSATFAATGEVDVPHNPSLAVTGDITLMAWVNPTDLTADRGIVNKVADGSVGTTQSYPAPYDFYILNTTGTPHYQRGNGTPGTLTGGHCSTGVSTGVWTFATVSVSGTAASFYINGAFVNTVTLGAFTIADIGTPAGIGRRPPGGGGGNQMVGGLDEVAIFNRALSAAEILAIYNAGTATGAPVTVVVPPAVATASSVAPSIVLTAVPGTATAASVAPGVVLTAPAATSTASSVAPVVTAVEPVTAGAATAGGVGPGEVLTAVPGTATASGVGPSVYVTVPAGLATASSVAPKTIGTVPPGVATASGVAPTVVLTSPVGVATAAGLAPGIVVSAPAAVATAVMPVPSTSSALTTVAPPGTATASGVGPRIVVTVTAAVATAVMPAPTASSALTVTVPPGVATGSGVGPGVVVTVPVPAAGATAVMPAPVAITPVNPAQVTATNNTATNVYTYQMATSAMTVAANTGAVTVTDQFATLVTDTSLPLVIVSAYG